MKIKISDIIITQDNPRKEFKREDIERMGGSLAKYGQLHSIIVRSTSNNKFELVTGELRLRSAIVIGWKEIEAEIQELSDTQCKIFRLIENIHRVDLSSVEKGDAVLELMKTEEYKDKDWADMAEDLGVAEGTITSNWLSQSLKASSKVKEYAAKGRLAGYQVQKIIWYPEDIQDKLVSICDKYQNPNPSIKTASRFRAFMNEFEKNPNMKDKELEELANRYSKYKPSEMVLVPKTEITPEQKKHASKIPTTKHTPRFADRPKHKKKDLSDIERCICTLTSGKRCTHKKVEGSEYCKNHLFERGRSGKQLRELPPLSERERPKIPEGEFDIIYADPPWKYDFSANPNRTINITTECHYPVMELEDIKNMNVPSSEDSILFLWATSPKLKEALEVMEAWGFKYLTNMVWVKDKIGMGYYAREKHELLLIGKKGKISPPVPENRPDSVLESPRREHSQKPDEMYERIERMYPNRKYLELFSRNKRKGWTTSGTEELK